ncbi:membrane protein [Actinomadura sp. NBRC 104412]|uniref:DsbA family protein n=1 Tax=Actinomadura sp. NBRC 104412 TaxID=3032203 RepID=UPI0024A39DA5|nr:thioredoxin domain-containing protein [Actinomadura sp. NBRC 104412]GLZ03685.1 membrane protein [Actinomadura sp. NBRC 104412]
MSKAARERTARERLAEERRRQAARAKQRRLLTVVLGAVAVVALIVVVTVIVLDQRGQRDQTATPYRGPQAPLTRQSDGSIVMAKPGVNAPVLEVFEDFQCPACKAFEENTGKTVKQLAAEGKAKVVYRPFHLFGEQRDPIRSNSLRSAAAALCVPAPQWLSYHDALFTFQPREGSEGFATRDLVAWGRDVGVTDPNFEKCVTDQQKKPQVDAMTTYALQTRGVTGTPTVFLDGRKLENELQDPAALQKAVADAKGSQ